MHERKFVSKPVIFGLLGSLSLFLAYFLILSLLNSASHAFTQFIDLWYLMLPLIIGLGTQIGLYVYIRESFKTAKSVAATASVTASGGVSTVSMAACCAHHLTDVLPLIGLSFLSTVLNKYQTSFIILGVLSNLIGITLMLNVIQKNYLHESWSGILGSIMKINMKKSLRVVIVFSVVIFSFSFYISMRGG
jgi:hypothetical protein